LEPYTNEYNIRNIKDSAIKGSKNPSCSICIFCLSVTLISVNLVKIVIFLYRFYRVIVVMVDETVTNIAQTFSRNLLSYQEWIRRENKIGFPYIAFVFKGDSFEQHKNFIVGDPDHTYRRKKRATLPKNGNLIPGKQYAVALRGYTAEVILQYAHPGPFFTK
jgi:hypothetical protein